MSGFGGHAEHCARENSTPLMGSDPQQDPRMICALKEVWATPTARLTPSEGPSEGIRTQGSPIASAEAFESAWRERINRWWLALPATAAQGLRPCIGALGLHLAERLEQAQREVRAALGVPVASSPPPTVGTECEWVRERAPQLGLPPFPNLERFERFEALPIPRLLPSDTLLLQSREPSYRQDGHGSDSSVGTRLGLSSMTLGAAAGGGAALLAALGMVACRRLRPLGRPQLVTSHVVTLDPVVSK